MWHKKGNVTESNRDILTHITTGLCIHIGVVSLLNELHHWPFLNYLFIFLLRCVHAEICNSDLLVKIAKFGLNIASFDVFDIFGVWLCHKHNVFDQTINCHNIILLHYIIWAEYTRSMFDTLTPRPLRHIKSYDIVFFTFVYKHSFSNTPITVKCIGQTWYEC